MTPRDAWPSRAADPWGEGSAYGPWRVTSADLASRGEALETDVAALIRAEIHSQGGDARSRVYAKDDPRVKDMGIDVLVDGFDGDSPHLPRGRSVWAVTAMRMETRTVRSWIGRQLRDKEALRRERDAGAICVFACAAELGAKAEDLERRFGVRVLDGAALAEWANRHKGVAFRVRGHPALLDLESALRRVPAGPPFLWDDIGERTRDRLIGYVEGRTPSPPRVEGAPGTGKTRLVLQSLADRPGAAERVVYWSGAREANLAVHKLIADVAHGPGREAILVIDECPRVQHREWVQAVQLKAGEQRLRLITVGRSEPPAGPPAPGEDLIAVPPRDELVRRFLAGFVFSSEIGDVLAREAGGFIKAASLLAAYVEAHPEASAASLRAAIDRDLFRRALRDRARFVEPLALFAELGWYGDLQAEHEVVAARFGLAAADLRRQVEWVREEGLIQPRHDCLYVTPDVLANHLAVLCVRDAREEIVDLYFDLPGRARRAMLERLAPLRDDAGVRQVLGLIRDRIAGGGGGGGGAGLSAEDADALLLLADTFPDGVLDTLTGTIEGRDVAELRGRRQERRAVVWALERLAAKPEHFAGAGRLLLALAEAENEHYGNNATGVWTGLFGAGLAGTQADNDARLDLLHEAARSASPARRRLAVAAAGLLVSTPAGFSVASYLDPRRPQDFRDLPRLHREAWRIVGAAFGDDDEAVRREAERIVRHSFREALARVPEEALAAVDGAGAANDAARRAFRLAVADALHFDVKVVGPAVADRLRAALERLEGDRFRDRLRRWAGEPAAGEWEQEHAGGSVEQACRALAAEAVAEPALLEAELDWLSSGEAVRAWQFLRALGEVDRGGRFLASVERVLGHERGAFLAGAYLHGRAGDGERVLDDWDARGGRHAAAAFEATVRRPVTEHGLDRSLASVRRGDVPAAALYGFVWGAVAARSLPAAAIARLIDAARESADPTACAAAVGIACQWRDIRGPGPDADRIARQALPLLVMAIAAPGQHAQHTWSEVAGRVMEAHPGEVIDAILAATAGRDVDKHLAATLVSACRVEPERLWPRIGERFLADHRLRWAMRGRLDDLPAGLLLRWAAASPEGPHKLAQAVTLSGVPMPVLTRRLIERFGDDRGVRDILSTRHARGPFAGSWASWLRERLKEADAWSRQREPQLARWARRQVRRIDQEMEVVRRRGLDAW